MLREREGGGERKTEREGEWSWPPRARRRRRTRNESGMPCRGRATESADWSACARRKARAGRARRPARRLRDCSTVQSDARLQARETYVRILSLVPSNVREYVSLYGDHVPARRETRITSETTPTDRRRPNRAAVIFAEVDLSATLSLPARRYSPARVAWPFAFGSGPAGIR